MALAEVTRVLHGRRATIVLADGRSQEGRIEFVRSDSTAWLWMRTRRAVPTPHVRTIIRDTRLPYAAAGLAAGVGLGLGVRLVTGTFDSDISGEGFTGLYLRYVVTPTLAVFGTVAGASQGQRVEYELVE